MGKKVFVIDIARCNGCYCCQIACKDEHVDNDWSPYAKPQPDTGQFWLKLNEYVRGTVPKVKLHYVPVPCQHCENASCMNAAPEAVYRRDDGLVIVDPEKAKGNKDLVDACPYGAIYWNEELQLPQKCTGCAHLLDDGWTVPRCVDICSTGAIKFGDEEDFKEETASATLLGTADETAPRVYYLNMPKRFIGGLVYDSVEKEIVGGARCTLTDNATGQKRETLTDGFGDFWFEGLDGGLYSLEITSGKQVKTFTGLDTSSSDINLGDIALP